MRYARLRAREKGRRERRKKGEANWNFVVFQLFEVSCALLSLVILLRYYPSMLIQVKARIEQVLKAMNIFSWKKNPRNNKFELLF